MGVGTAGIAGMYATAVIGGTVVGSAMTWSTSAILGVTTGRSAGQGIVAIANWSIDFLISPPFLYVFPTYSDNAFVVFT